ncbi:helix-turn-helix domain-containing protein [Rhodopseudomonas telluris]|uniref:Helix-turn-helix domain-containing protein n=1 Tax=Rhodopseudomonas telluris TaxID=644215 RepID=A0ABV6ELR2_9BRAD
MDALDQHRDQSAHHRAETIDFKSIAASISIVTGEGTDVRAGQDGWRYRAADGGPETLLSFPDVARPLPRHAADPSADQDPMVARLSEALAAAERDPSEFSALYADAVRLVTVVRRLSIEGHAGAFKPPQTTPTAGLPKWRLKLVCDHVTAHLGEKVTLADMAAAARLSRMHFAALFLRATGMRPHQYLLQRRIAAAQELLQDTNQPIIQIAIQVGFQTQAHFTTVFKKITGVTPAKWREMVRSQGSHPDQFGSDLVVS